MCNITGRVMANDDPHKNRVTGGILRISCMNDMAQRDSRRQGDMLQKQRTLRMGIGQQCRLRGTLRTRSETLHTCERFAGL